MTHGWVGSSVRMHGLAVLQVQQVEDVGSTHTDCSPPAPQQLWPEGHDVALQAAST